MNQLPTPGGRLFVTVFSTAAVLALSPSSAAAQRQIFVEGLSELTVSIAGTFGDEGTEIARALDTMASGLAEWDRTIQAFEARLAAELPGASPRVAAQMRATLGAMYVERGRHADALRELEEASRLAPERADLHVRRGLLLDEAGRPDEAGQAFRAARAADPNDPVAAYHAFRHWATAGSITGRDDARQGPLETLAAAYRDLLHDDGAPKAAPFVGLELLPDVATYPLILPPAAYVQGYESIARGQYQRAIAELRQAAATDPLVADPASQSASTRQAVAALRQGSLADARSLLEGAAALPRSSEVHRLLGLIRWASSQPGESIEQLEIAIDRNPRDERSRVTLARVLSSVGRDSAAARVLQEAIQVLPESVLARWWLSSTYQRLIRFADARQELELASVGAPAGRHGLAIAIGRLAGTATDLRAAADAFARSVRASPNDPSTHKDLAGVLLQLDRADEAFVELVAVLLIDRSDAGAHAAVGQIHLNAGRYDEAVVALRRALELSPAHVEARYALGTALMRLGRTQDGTRELERFDQARRQALEERRRTMALDVLREEAALRAGEGSHGHAAALWQQVVDREPDQASNRLGLAEALVRAGRLEQAVEQYEAAVTLGVEAEVYHQLAELYATLGRIDDASRAGLMYYKALQRHPSSGSPPP